MLGLIQKGDQIGNSLSKPRQQGNGGNRENDAHEFTAVERFIEEKKAHEGKHQDHADGLDRADRRDDG